MTIRLAMVGILPRGQLRGIQTRSDTSRGGAVIRFRRPGRTVRPCDPLKRSFCTLGGGIQAALEKGSGTVFRDMAIEVPAVEMMIWAEHVRLLEAENGS